MKRTYVRIGVALVLLGALAAIPASTQVFSIGSARRATLVDLPLLLVVNRLELRAQMETAGDHSRLRRAERTRNATRQLRVGDDHVPRDRGRVDVRIDSSRWRLLAARFAAAAAAVDTVKEMSR
jgi:hypothetical protein